MQPWRRLRTLSALFLATWLVWAGAAAAREAPVLQRVVESGQLRVGMSGNQPLFNSMSYAGTLVGIDVELSRRLAGAMGVELKIVIKPFGELLPALDAGDVDLVMSGMSITAERAVNYTFVGPYMMSGKSILTKSSLLASAESVTDIDRPDIKLAALENSTSQRFAERYFSNSQLVKVKNYDDGVAMVRNGAVHALVADLPICVLSARRYANEGLKTMPKPLTIEPIGIAVPATDLQFLHLLQTYLDGLDQSGVIADLHKKWLEDDAWLPTLK